MKIIILFFSLIIGLPLLANTGRYRLMFNTDPSTEITIGWEQVSGNTPIVYYDVVDHGTNTGAYAFNNGVDRQVTYQGMDNRFSRLTGLQPNTIYYFVIGDSQGAGQRYWFKTCPDVNTETISFISGGDSRSGTTQRQNSNRMVAKIRPHAVLFGGDLQNTPSEAVMQQWLDDWQLTITSDNQMIPCLHSFGNHEDYGNGGANLIRDLFDTPYDVYYNVRFGGDLFSMYTLNGEVLPGHTIANNGVRVAQRNWLNTELQADNSIWKGAQYHRPIVPHYSGKGEGSDEFYDWANLFYEYGVRLAMESDAHVVKITEEVRPVAAYTGLPHTSPGGSSSNWFTSTGLAPNKGITFIGEGTWGTIRTPDDSHPMTTATASFYGFNWILVDACKIQIRTIDTQNPGAVPEHVAGDYTSISAGLEAQVWKPGAIPSGLREIIRCNPPLADFTADLTAVFTGSTVNFTDLSTNSPTSWFWDFGDGNTSTLQNPSNLYATAGTYTVTLTATNSEGTDDEIKTGYIIVSDPAPPTADFVADITSASVGQNINFSDLTTGVPSIWFWDFGDGLGTSTLQNPTYAYGAAGTYTVTLTATNIYGSDSEIKVNYIVVVNGGSVSVYVATGNDDAEQFRDDNSMYLTSTDLELGNDLGTEQYVGVRFQNVTVPQGAVISNARIRFRCDEADAFSSQLNIYFKAHDVDNSPQYTTANSNISNRVLTTAMTTWAHGTVPGWNVGVYYDSPNLSAVVQEVVDRAGWNSGNALSFVIWSDLGETSERIAESYEGGSPAQLIFDYIVPTPPAPVANFSASTSSACQGSSISLTDMSTNNPVAWSWTVTGPQTLTSTAQNPTFNFTSPGTYSVELVASNVGGSDTYNQINLLTINPTPSTPSITAGGATTFCAGGSVTLSAPASSSYLWSNGATTQSINATVAGSYTVQVTNASGCQSVASSSTAVTVNSAPSTPSITAGGATTFCAGGSVTLSAPASSSYLWSNGATTQSINATVAGSYTVQVTNASGCQSAGSATSTVTVNPLPIIASGNFTHPNACAALTGSAEITGSGLGNLTWTGSANGSLNNVVLPSTVTTLGAGSYTFLFEDANGCQSNSLLVVLTDPTPATAPVITASGATTFCAGGSVTLSSSESAGNTWSTSDMSNAIVVSTSGTYLVTYTDINGCSATSAPVTVTVNPAPSTPSITAGGATTFCYGGSVTLTSSEGSGNTWSTSASTPSINVTSTGSFAVTYTDVNGCQATSVATPIIVNPLPIVTYDGVSDTICETDNPFTLTDGTPTGGIFSGPGVSGNMFDPSTAGVGTHTLSYEYTDGNGCSNTDQGTIMLEGCLSLPNLEEIGYRIYPNPSDELIYIERGDASAAAEMSIFDKSGRLMYSANVIENPIVLDVTEWPSGSYMISLTINGKQHLDKIIKR